MRQCRESTESARKGTSRRQSGSSLMMHAMSHFERMPTPYLPVFHWMNGRLARRGSFEKRDTHHRMRGTLKSSKDIPCCLWLCHWRNVRVSLAAASTRQKRYRYCHSALRLSDQDQHSITRSEEHTSELQSPMYL